MPDITKIFRQCAKGALSALGKYIRDMEEFTKNATIEIAPGGGWYLVKRSKDDLDGHAKTAQPHPPEA